MLTRLSWKIFPILTLKRGNCVIFFLHGSMVKIPSSDYSNLGDQPLQESLIWWAPHLTHCHDQNHFHDHNYQGFQFQYIYCCLSMYWTPHVRVFFSRPIITLSPSSDSVEKFGYHQLWAKSFFLILILSTYINIRLKLILEGGGDTFQKENSFFDLKFQLWGEDDERNPLKTKTLPRF